MTPLSILLVVLAACAGPWRAAQLVAPMREMSMMVGAPMGMVILREAVGTWRTVGCAVLVGGVVLMFSC